MPRSLATIDRNKFETAPNQGGNDEVYLFFVTLTPPKWNDPIRIVSENGGISTSGGKVINYKRGADTWFALPFRIVLLTDNDGPPRAAFRMQNIDQKIGQIVLGIKESPRVKLEILKFSDFTAGVDIDNARTPLGSPTILWGPADHLRLRDVRGDALAIEATLTSYDLSDEPWPAIRATIDRLPALHYV